MEMTIHTLDLRFRGQPGTIAAYLIPHRHGALLVECGPASTLPALEAGLREHGLTLDEVSDVLLTHIHLDHGGAAGWLARRGARIYVHPQGAPHLVNPEKLLASAARIYGDQMTDLWGEFLPVSAEQLTVVEDGQVLEIEGLQFTALATLGHASHHHAYLFQGVCFSGDIGGVRLGGVRHLRLPMPPPEFHLEQWRESLRRLQSALAAGRFTRIAPTHFGIYDDAAWHLAAAQQALDEVEAWMVTVMPSNPPLEALSEQFVLWSRQRTLNQGIDPTLLDPLETANPSWMSAAGIHRYWHKVRLAAAET